jgi:hypothetical protein
MKWIGCCQYLRRIAVGLFLGLVLHTANAEQHCSLWLPRAANGECGMYEVSLVQLIANPDSFEGKRVAVIGFLNTEFEGDALYLHQEDWGAGIPLNSVSLVVPPNWFKNSACRSQSYVLLHGVFTAKTKGHAVWRAGSLESIDLCRQWR